MMKFKLFMQLACIMMLVFSCSKEEVPSSQIETQNNVEFNRNRAPQIHFENYTNFCGNGPQVQLRFSDCDYSSTFFVNVFKYNGSHVYSWPVDNPNLNDSVGVIVGSTPFTFPNGLNTCSLFIEGNTYYFSISYTSSNTVFSDTYDNFYIPVTNCECTG